MDIDLKEIKVRDLTNGYQDNAEDGVLRMKFSAKTPRHRKPPKR